MLALARRRSFFKGCLLLGIGFLVAASSRLPLDPMFLEEPPQGLAVLVDNAPLLLQVVAGILHGRDASCSHRLQQARPCLWGELRGLPCWLLSLEHRCQPLCPIAFPPAGQLDHT